MASSELWAIDYEIYGEVQGVFFRKYTEDQGRKLGLVGWVKNTAHGTVTGQVQGTKEKVEIIIGYVASEAPCLELIRPCSQMRGRSLLWSSSPSPPSIKGSWLVQMGYGNV
ncbi:acylphosphatase-1-like isoform 1-T1 [Vipera latastei]